MEMSRTDRCQVRFQSPTFCVTCKPLNSNRLALFRVVYFTTLKSAKVLINSRIRVARAVEYVLQDYTKPMGVATYKSSQERLRELLPDEEEIKKLL